MLPTFLIIGAMKAGTSSLHRYLEGHPQVFMSEPKELNFFVPVRDWYRGRAWYESQFEAAGDARARGESSPSYAMNPVLQGVPEAIASMIPDVRLVYLVRHPIERIRSMYIHARSRHERRPIDRAVVEDHRYLIVSRYAHQLQQYLRVFPREQILVLEAADLHQRRDEVYDRVCDFIGVETGVRPDVLSTEFHRSSDKPVPTALGDWWERRELPGRARLRRWLERPMRPDETTLSRAVERWLQLHLQPDLEQLAELMGPGFDCWGLLDPDLTAASWSHEFPDAWDGVRTIR